MGEKIIDEYYVYCKVLLMKVLYILVNRYLMNIFTNIKL